MSSLFSSSFHTSLRPHSNFHSNYIFQILYHHTFLFRLQNYSLTFNSAGIRSNVLQNGRTSLLLQLPCSSFSMDNDHFPSSSSTHNNQLGFDPSEDLFGLDVDLPPRDKKPETPEPRSWFGPNGQYIKELPCPSCRGRGYTPCTVCGIERSAKDCSLCSGKGMITCQRCLGERVIWEEKIDEKPWEKAHSVSPLIVKEDDEVDDLDLSLDVKKKSKRVYRSPPPEVGLKISRSLKLDGCRV